MNLPDFREPLTQAQQWVLGLVSGIEKDQLALPTPCPAYDVRGLVAHVYLGAERVTRMGEGGVADEVQVAVEDLSADLAAGYEQRISTAQRVWGDAALLARPARAPWGEVPGAFAVAGYLMETLAHGWDLAVATGQPSEIEPGLAVLGLEVAQRAIPAEPRGGEFPFSPVVDSASTDSPTLRFVHWTGRQDWPAR